MRYGIIFAFGILWIAAPAEAQTADSAAVIQPQPSRIGPPPKRGAPPVRKADEKDPTLNNGKVTWTPRFIEMGAFPQGKPQVKEIKVTNISNEPLEILKVKTSCHCTSAEWPQGKIEPGQSGIIYIRHSAEDLGEFLRIVSIQTNFDLENWVMVSVTGEVKQ